MGSFKKSVQLRATPFVTTYVMMDAVVGFFAGIAAFPTLHMDLRHQHCTKSSRFYTMSYKNSSQVSRQTTTRALKNAFRNCWNGLRTYPSKHYIWNVGGPSTPTVVSMMQVFFSEVVFLASYSSIYSCMFVLFVCTLVSSQLLLLRYWCAPTRLNLVSSRHFQSRKHLEYRFFANPLQGSVRPKASHHSPHTARFLPAAPSTRQHVGHCSTR